MTEHRVRSAAARGLRLGLLGLCALVGATAHALEGKVVATGFVSPVFVTAPAGDKRLFVVEQGGVIRLLKDRTVSTFLDISARVDAAGERGLLGLAFDPDYATNGRFYVDYVDKRTHDSMVARYTVSAGDPDVADPASRQHIITIAQESFTNHKAGWIGFRPGNPKNLFIALGDGGASYDPNNNGQNPKVLLGKMLRIDVSGKGTGYKLPTDNPFIDSPDVLPEIWALGLRNPFRDSFDRKTGAFWIADVGQDSREEIDFEAPDDPGGHNYGWRLREGKIETPNVGGRRKGMTDPVFDYPHSGGDSLGQCVIGGYVYRGPSVPEADGRYFFGDCVSNRAFSFDPDRRGRPQDLREETADLIAGTGLATLDAFGEDGKGRLYLAGQSGVLVVMCPSAPMRAQASAPPRDRDEAASALGASGSISLHAAASDPCKKK